MNEIQFMKLRSQLSQSEKIVFDYCVNHRNELDKMTIQMIAKALFISPATISRMAQKMDFTGFKEFKYTLLLLTNQQLPVQSTLPNFVSDYEKQISHNISTALNAINEENLYQAINLIEEAKSLEVFAVGGSNVNGQDFTRKMQNLDYNIFGRQDWDELIRVSQRLHEQDLAIFFSQSGQTKLILECARNLKNNHVKILSFISSSTSMLESISDCTFICPAVYHYKDEADLSSRIVFNAVTDLIIWQLAEKI